VSRIKNYIIFVFLSFLFIACTTQADTKISFGGYHFNTQKTPTLVGSTHESLVLHFKENEKLIFVHENYTSYDEYNVSATQFIEIVFGGAIAENNQQLTFLKEQLALNEIKRSKLEIKGITVYLIDYAHKKYAILFNSKQTQRWVAVEAQNMDLKKIILSLMKVG